MSIWIVFLLNKAGRWRPTRSRDAPFYYEKTWWNFLEGSHNVEILCSGNEPWGFWWTLFIWVFLEIKFIMQFLAEEARVERLVQTKAWDFLWENSAKKNSTKFVKILIFLNKKSANQKFKISLGIFDKNKFFIMLNFSFSLRVSNILSFSNLMVSKI